jgi:hypothetical protein
MKCREYLFKLVIVKQEVPREIIVGSLLLIMYTNDLSPKINADRALNG